MDRRRQRRLSAADGRGGRRHHDPPPVHTSSVIGQELPAQLLREVCGLGGTQLAEALESLGHAQLVVPAGGTRRGDYEFRHPLTQEVAYTSLLSQRRASAHRAVAAGI